MFVGQITCALLFVSIPVGMFGTLANNNNNNNNNNAVNNYNSH